MDAHRRLQGLPPLFHVRLKHLAILSGGSEQEAQERAQRLACALFPADEALTIEQA